MARSGKRKEDDVRSGRRIAGSGLVTWLLLCVTVVVGAVLRVARLGEAPGGFMAFNEYFYLDIAKRELLRDPFAWFYNSIDLNNPPLYNGLISTVLRFGVSPVAGARVVSVLAGIATVVVLFLLGRLLYDEYTGLVAAAAYAVMPGVVLTNHSIQVDSVFVALLVAGVFYYVRSVRRGAMTDAIIGGVLLGLSMLTKQPALLALLGLIVWRTWAQGGIAWLRDKRTWVFVACALSVGGSWYAGQLVFRPGEFLAAMSSVAGYRSMSAISAYFVSDVLFGELVWMVFPLAVIAAIVGLVVMVRRGSAGDMLVLTLAGLYLLYYVGFHKHSYYLLPVAPFLALMIARGAVSAFDEAGSVREVRAALVSVLLVAMLLGSAVMMGGKKWGRWAPADLQIEPTKGNQRVHIYYNPKLDGLYWTMSSRIDPKHQPTPAEVDEYFSQAKPPEAAGTQRLYLSQTLASSDEQGREQLLPANRVLTETRVRPVLAGYAIGERWSRETRAQTFKNGPWTAEKVGFLWQFGMHSQEVSADFALYD